MLNSTIAVLVGCTYLVGG